MVFAFLSGIAGALFGLSYKVRARMELDYRIVLITSGVWSLLMSIAGIFGFGEPFYSTAALLIGVPYGSTIAVSMIIYFRVVEQTKLNISWTFIQLSVIVPFAISVAAYGERVTWRETVGVALIFVAILLLGFARTRGTSDDAVTANAGRKGVGALVITFLLTGISQCFAKFYQAIPGKQPTVTILLYISIGMLLTSIVAWWVPPRGKDGHETRPTRLPAIVLFSLLMSAARLSVPLFLLLALRTVKGAVVFPLRSMINIVLLVILSYVVYREKLKLTEALGIPAAIAAITLLTV